MVSFLVLLGLEQFRHPQPSSHSCTEGSHRPGVPVMDVTGLLCGIAFFLTCFFFRKCDSVNFKHLVTQQQHTDFSFQLKVLKIGSTCA